MSYSRLVTSTLLFVLFTVAAEAQCTWPAGNATRVLLPANCQAGIGSSTTDSTLTLQNATGNALTLKDTAGSTRFNIFTNHASPYYVELNSNNYDMRLTTFTGGGSGGNISFLTSTTTTPVERMRILGSGFVGIGTASPNAPLTVAGASGNIVNVLDNANNTRFSIFAQNASPYYMELNSYNYDLRLTSATTSGSGGNIIFNTNTVAGGVERMRITPAGYVGIGASAPASPLTVAGVVQSTSGGFKFPDGSVQTSAAGIAPNGSGNFNFGGNVGVGTDPGSIPLYVAKNGTPLGGTVSYVARFDNATGTQGVVVGYDSSQGGVIASTGQHPLSFWTYNGSAWGERMRVDSNGNVAVGATTPNAALHVYRSASTLQAVGSENRLLQLGSNSYDNTYGGQFEFRERRYSASVNGGHALAIYGKNAADATLTADRFLMTIQSNGNVGIGNINPAKTLDVAGDIYASGTISGGNVVAQYQDVAEWVPSGGTLSPGTVVIINPDKRNEVVPSSHAYDTAVAGVVSDKPGVLLGVASDVKSKIATTGRVRVHVDAAKHPIHAGDLLVTSDTPGVAMVSEAVDVGGVKMHRPGTLIGKALEPLQSGQGDILVLLSLQ